MKDPYAYHPALAEGIRGAESDPRGAAPEVERHLQAFLREAEGRGIRVLLDLVVNHTAKDAGLVEEHPEWYMREPDGSIRSPFAIDPADARRITVWGDLAELNYEDPAARAGLVDRWSRFIEHALRLGFAGFRCDAAYKVPAEAWSELIAAGRAVRPDALFCAETLGCRLEEVSAVAAAGFDYLFNSSKWWDFRAPWALEQYASHRRIAPSISFPETHDTPRLAEEVQGRPEILRQRYLFAAAFATGVMAPIGFEYGARRELNVVRTRPADREPVVTDLTEFIAAVNELKASSPVLNEEGPLELLGQDGPIVRLRKGSEREAAPAALWIHTGNGEAPAPVEEAERALDASRERLRAFSSAARELAAPLEPYEMRVVQTAP